MQARIGEVIESTTTGFTGGAYELLEAPPFGALVRAQARVEDMAVYGLVYDIRTGSKEPGGRALVRGRTYSGRELYDAEIYHEHPDLAEVLQTEFSAITVGFVEHGHIHQYLAAAAAAGSLQCLRVRGRRAGALHRATRFLSHAALRLPDPQR